jgi:pimeloyl-ACP methyl ester carboxylesterase
MRGWLGIFSTGMMQLSDKLNNDVGVTSVSLADMEYMKLQDWLVEQHKEGKLNEPLVLLGHSWGADDMIRVAQKLDEHRIPVDLLVLIDPVTPPAVTPNVKRVYCVYKSQPLTDWYPAWRGVPASVQNPGATSLTNIDLRTADVGFNSDNISHPYIDKFEGVHKMAIEEIEKVCPPRTAWMQSHPPGSNPVTQMPARLPVTPAPSSAAPSKPESAAGGQNPVQ